MATVNPFDLLVDDDNDDPSQLIAAQQLKIVPKKALAPTQAQAQPAKPAKLPTKPLPPAQAVREAKNDSEHGGGRGGRRGFGNRHVGGGFSRETTNNENSFDNSRFFGGPDATKELDTSKPSERRGGFGGFFGGQGATKELDTSKPSERRGGYGGPHGSFHGGRSDRFSNGENGDGEHTHKTFERRSGTRQGNEFKREGAGGVNRGTPTDKLSQVTEEVVNESEKDQGAEKPSGEEVATVVNKENPGNKTEEKEPEAKEMTLEEYEKVLEEKRKALQALKTEERKVDVDKEFKSMQQLSNKKDSNDVFVKLGSGKDKRKELAEKEEKAKKSVSINEFLKPAEGEKYYSPGSRGRGRGRGSRGGYGGGNTMSNAAAPKIEDPGQFPTLGVK